MTPLVIVGAGGHGREILDVVEAINAVEPTFDVLGFVDDGAVDEEILARRGVRCLGPAAVLATLDARYVLGIGSSTDRARLDAELGAWGRSSAVLVHPRSSVGSDTVFAAGVVLAAGARVTTNVRLGRHTHVNVNAVVSHDCRLGDHVTVSPGVNVNGGVVIGDGVFLGTGAIVAPGCCVGAGAMIGAGAVVLSEVPPGVRAVGVPARWD